MDFIVWLRTIFETVTAFSAAIIVIIHFLKLMPKSIKKFFIKTIPLFFIGTLDANRKEVRFFKALKIEKENEMKIQNLIQIIAPNYTDGEYLILNKTELLNLIKSSNLFIHVSKQTEESL